MAKGSGTEFAVNGELEKPVFVVPRALSSSKQMVSFAWSLVHCLNHSAQHTTQAIFNGRLDWRFKDCSLFPNINDPSKLGLYFGKSSFVRDRSGLSDGRRERDDEILLVSDSRLLRHLCLYG